MIVAAVVLFVLYFLAHLSIVTKVSTLLLQF